MTERPTPDWIRRLSPEQRLEAADHKVQSMLDLAIELIHLHECNRLIAYDNRVKDQIPLSHAGVAYRVFSRGLVQRELAGVCTFWDPAGIDRNSIPTVLALLDSKEVRAAIHNRKVTTATEGRSLSAEDNDPELLDWIKKLSDADIAEGAIRRTLLLDDVIERATFFSASSRLRAARDWRDARLAHNLSPTARKFPDLNTKFGDEGKLLEETLPILECVNLVARNSSYDWTGTWQIAKKNAEALWLGCRFDILE